MALFLWSLKKIVGRLLFPLSLVTGLLVLGLLLKKRGRLVLAAGAGLLYLFSFAPIGALLLTPLEGPHRAVQAAAVNPAVAWVVVLGGGARDDARLTPEDSLGHESLKRLLEGLRLCRLLPEARLVLSGGNYPGLVPEAILMRDVALAQGFPGARILLEPHSLDTADQARTLRTLLGVQPFYLVTSASHMTRALGMFRAVQTNPLAAPTDFRAVPGPFRAWDLFPQAGALATTERAFYEYIGLAWALLRGQR